MGRNRFVYSVDDTVIIRRPGDTDTPEPTTHIIIKGGPGSGHHGHAGRPGKRGGSLPGGGLPDMWKGWGKFGGAARVITEKLGSVQRFGPGDRKGMWDFIEQAGWPYRDRTEEYDPEFLDWLKREHPEWAAGKLYTGNSGMLNHALRNWDKPLPDVDRDVVKGLVSQIDPYIQTLQLPSDALLLRGVNDTAPFVRYLPDMIGFVLKDPGYMSTSLDPYIMSDFSSFFDLVAGDIAAHIAIIAREGQPAGLGSYSETELVLPRNTKLLIHDVHPLKMRMIDLLGHEEIEYYGEGALLGEAEGLRYLVVAEAIP